MDPYVENLKTYALRFPTFNSSFKKRQWFLKVVRYRADLREDGDPSGMEGLAIMEN